MTKIKEIFGKDKSIYDPIDKVVTFGNASEYNLKKEVSEYVVTERLKDNFERILDVLYTGMTDGSNEIGIWVSGFYGSGKSSFAKYLGYGLQKDYMVKGELFLDRLANRINSLPVNQQFKTIVSQFDPAVILLDCATEQIKGGTLPPILELLNAKVNQLAGFSTDSKLADLEQMLIRDDRLDEFVLSINEKYDQDWSFIKINDLLRAKSIAGNLAADFYPELWEDRRDFKITRVDDSRTDKEKIEQMLATIQRITGKENIIFIVDEVGQYISAKDDLILSLQGTVQTLRDIGGGKYWFLATAQQTLTEDNPNARLNSDKLYRLTARFPIIAEIEASDIKEICTQRILGKSSSFSDQLKTVYSLHGERLRHYTQLENCERTLYVKDALNEGLFVDLYPFLPHHFEIIISLLGRLAKVTGGVGLRSAIKVIQDVLTKTLPSEEMPLAEFKVGKLATTYHIYDVLKSDIRKSYSHVVGAVDRIVSLHGDASFQAKVSKSIAILQLLDDFHLSTKNLAAMMHPEAASGNIIEAVTDTVDELKNTRGCTLNEIDGELRFMTDAIINLENEKDRYTPSSSDIRRVYEGIIKDVFSPVPQARLLNTKTVRTGINLNQGGRLFKLLEPNEEIQTEIIPANPSDYARISKELLRESTEKDKSTRIYILGSIESDIDSDIIEIVKNEQIYNSRKNYNDKEINDYLNSQNQQAQQLKDSVRRIIIQSLEKGEFIFRGASQPTTRYTNKFREAVNGKLKEVAEKVFDKYQQAPISVAGSDAERLLTFKTNLNQFPANLNYFDLIKNDGNIDLDKEAVKSIREFIIREEQVEGRKLLEYFDSSPYGWSKDTTRFIVAAMFIASDIKLRVAGEDIKVKGPKAIEALKNVNNFNKIGVSAYQSDEKPSREMIALSVKRLAHLTGVQVPPLQDKIAEVVRKHFPEFQTKYSSIKTNLRHLNLPGQELAQEVQDGLSEVLKGEGADAAFRLGKKTSDLYENLIWIQEVHKEFQNGMEDVFKEANILKSSIDALPNSGLPMELKKSAENEFDIVEEITNDTEFFNRVSDLRDAISNIKSLSADYCQKILDSENEKIKNRVNQIKYTQNWTKLEKEQKNEIINEINALIIEDKHGLDGIKEILNLNYSINNSINAIEEKIEEYVKKNQENIEKDDLEEDGVDVQTRIFKDIPKVIRNKEQLDGIISKLESIREDLNGDIEYEIEIN